MMYMYVCSMHVWLFNVCICVQWAHMCAMIVYLCDVCISLKKHAHVSHEHEHVISTIIDAMLA